CRVRTRNKSGGNAAMKEILDILEERRAGAKLGGGEKRIEAQHARGKLTARGAMDFCSTRARSRNSTCSSSTVRWNSAWKRRRCRATAWSPAGAPSTAARRLSLQKTSPCLAARSAEPTRTQ